MNTIRCFPPSINTKCHSLVLGSMPGKVSLQEHQYYAHPRNGFWHIMGIIYGADISFPYEKRLGILMDHGIALWDVINSCERSTSLDADIAETSITTNDFDNLLKSYPQISRICFNGGKAQQSFNRYVRPGLGDHLTQLTFHLLTSTSPANARYSLSDKVAMWTEILIKNHPKP